MDLNTLAVFVVAEEGLEMFPAVEAANFAEGRGHDTSKGFGLTIAPDRAFDVCGLDFAAVEDDSAGLVDKGLMPCVSVDVCQGRRDGFTWAM